MKYFTDRFNSVLFVVCSDSMEWAKDNIKHPNVVFVYEVMAVDMSVLTHCNHTIITVGWGITVYYKHPVTEGSTLRTVFSKDYADYFYPDWIGME